MPKKKKGGSNASVSPAASVASNDDRPAASVASEDGSLSSKSELPGNYSGDLKKIVMPSEANITEEEYFSAQT